MRCRLLYHAVYDRRDAQRPLFAVCLGYIDTSYGGWLVRLSQYGGFYLIHMFRKIHIKLFCRHLVYAGRTMVALDTHTGFPEVSRFYNLVNQFHLLRFVLLVNILWSVPITSNFEGLRPPRSHRISFSDYLSITYSDLHYVYINPFGDGGTPTMGSADSRPWAFFAREYTLDGTLGVRH